METEGLNLPLVSRRIINAQMMEAEDHGQFFRLRIRVSDTVLQCGGRHLSHCNHILIFSKGLPVHLPEEFMNPRAVCVELLSVPLQVILIGPLGDQIDHVKPESLHAFFDPEVQDIIAGTPYIRILPVQICLRHMEQMEVILICLRQIAPCAPAEIRHPVRGRKTVLSLRKMKKSL